MLHNHNPRSLTKTDSINLFIKMQQVSKWIAMAYPTWLVFFSNETKIEDFLFEIYVPFDCKFMVARSSANEVDREIITEVYQVDKNKELRSMQFGVWDMRKGLKGPTRGLFLRRNDLFGQNIRVTSVHVRLLVLFSARELKKENLSYYEILQDNCA